MALSGPSIFSATQLADYDHVRHLTRSRVAWEYLRRNPDYGRDWRASAAGRPRPVSLIDGTTLLRTRRRSLRAEAWGLFSFRRPR